MRADTVTDFLNTIRFDNKNVKLNVHVDDAENIIFLHR